MISDISILRQIFLIQSKKDSLAKAVKEREARERGSKGDQRPRVLNPYYRVTNFLNYPTNPNFLTTFSNYFN